MTHREFQGEPQGTEPNNNKAVTHMRSIMENHSVLPLKVSEVHLRDKKSSYGMKGGINLAHLFYIYTRLRSRGLYGGAGIGLGRFYA